MGQMLGNKGKEGMIARTRTLRRQEMGSRAQGDGGTACYLSKICSSLLPQRRRTFSWEHDLLELRLNSPSSPVTGCGHVTHWGQQKCPATSRKLSLRESTSSRFTCFCPFLPLVARQEATASGTLDRGRASRTAR